MVSLYSDIGPRRSGPGLKIKVMALLFCVGSGALWCAALHLLV